MTLFAGAGLWSHSQLFTRHSIPHASSSSLVRGLRAEYREIEMEYVYSTGIPGSNGIRRNTSVFHSSPNILSTCTYVPAKYKQETEKWDSDSDSDESDEDDLKV